MSQKDYELQNIKSILEEKERDLLLSASIGKELLDKNTKLECKINELQAVLKSVNENHDQLSYQLSQKNDLINILTRDDDCDSENVTPTGAKSIKLDLQNKISTLEEENKNLRSEAYQIVQHTDEIELHERRLMDDLTKQLESQKSELESLQIELERYKEENRLQHDEILSLKQRLHETELRLHQLTSDNGDTSSLLIITKENQDSLAHELTEFKLRYLETLSLLHKTQEQLRKQMKKALPSVRGLFVPITTPFSTHSLQSELMNSLDSGILSDSEASKVSSDKSVCEIIKFVHNAGKDYSQSQHDNLSQITVMSSLPQVSNVYSNEDTFSAINEKISGNYDISKPRSQTGMPGCPGARDLEEALKRLTPAEILSRRAMLSYAPAGTYSYDEHLIRTPESIFSTISAGTGSTAFGTIPKKLEIVKPFEGSHTLNEWYQLANPTLGGLLHENERIKVRGEKPLDELGLSYSTADVDKEDKDHPGKQFESSTCIYTLTNSTVLHPDDGTTSVSFSLPPSQMSSMAGSRHTTEPSTPKNLSRRNSCSTFSVNIGLASMLNERGIKAVTPSALNSPSGQNFSPTVTPCNSPDEESSPTHNPLEVSIKNKSTLQNLEKKALRSLKFLERNENLSLDNARACKTVSPLALYSSNIYTSRSSPMAQLTSLRNLTDKRYSVENVRSHAFGINKSNDDSIRHSERKLSRTYRQRPRQRPGIVRSDLGKIERPKTEEKSLVEEFVGSISSMFFGRKGGLL